MKYDVVIAGSGLGGLLCGTILGKEGYRVCVVEKNPKIGGCLQSMYRDGCVFNTGVHYMGGLDEGQILHRYFKYFGLLGKIDICRLDDTGFEVISFDSGKEYRIGMGKNFVDSLAGYFPKERHALEQYAAKLREVCHVQPLYALNDSLHGAVLDKPYLGVSAEKYVHALTNNELLQKVLFGNDLMYGGISDKTSLLLYALINHSFMEGAWRMAGDSEQISEALAANILASGGHILCNRSVEHFRMEKEKITAAVLHTGEEVEGSQFISDLHPQNLLPMIESGYLKKSYAKKIETLQNTSGMFVLHVALKDQGFQYFNYNRYHYSSGQSWPQKFMMIPVGTENNGYSKGVTLMALIDYSEVKQWEGTKVEHRGADYLEFKSRKTTQMLDAVEHIIPGFRQTIVNWHASTPLSYRDYTGTPGGSAYGVLKDCNKPLSTMVFPRTRIPNLLLTGQNVYFHGVLGVSIGAVATCGELLGMKHLIHKIRD